MSRCEGFLRFKEITLSPSSECDQTTRTLWRCDGVSYWNFMKTFTSWHSCLPVKISMNSVAAKNSRLQSLVSTSFLVGIIFCYTGQLSVSIWFWNEKWLLNICVPIFMTTKRETLFLPHTLLFITQLITTPVTFKVAPVAQSNSSSMATVMSTNHSQLHLNKHTSTVCNIWYSHSSADEGSVLLGCYNVSTWCFEWALCPHLQHQTFYQDSSGSACPALWRHYALQDVTNYLPVVTMWCPATPESPWHCSVSSCTYQPA